MTEIMKPEEYRNQLLFGDSFEVLKRIPSNTVTAVVTDPPYGLSAQPDMKEVLKHWLAGDDYQHTSSGFMGKEWDSFVPGPKIWEEVMRVLKPGGHIFSFSGTRTYDLMVTAMRIAGAEVRDKIDYYCQQTAALAWVHGQGFPKSLDISKAIDKSVGAERNADDTLTAPATDEAKKWEGYGTALKPAHEPVAVFTKGESEFGDPDTPFLYEGKATTKERDYGCRNMFWKTENEVTVRITRDEYKNLQKENEDNKDKEEFVPHKISHGNIWPTVKPIELMRYLVKMVKMPNDNLILDPFMGSGSTVIGCILEGCDFIGIDMDPVAFDIATARTHYFRCLGNKGLK